ncbi:unnamed protein product [Durusdinium trenchii]
MPGQAFELAFTGGPPSNPRTYFDYISSDPAVASIDKEVGLVLALNPGSANLFVRLLEHHSGREIARAGLSVSSRPMELKHHILVAALGIAEGAHIKVTVPSGASIGVVDALTGQTGDRILSCVYLYHCLK